MFNLPKVKKTLVGLACAKRIKKVVASVIISAGLVLACTTQPTTVNATNIDNLTATSQYTETGALLLTSQNDEVGKCSWHQSHASHVSHASHESHVSHYSSRY